MKSKELAKKHNVSERYIRAKTKEASDKNELYVNIGSDKYNYVLKSTGRGRPAYFYEEVKSSEVVIQNIQTPRLDLEIKEYQKEKLDLKLVVMSEFSSWKRARRGTVKEFISWVEKHFDMKYTYRMHHRWEELYKANGARALLDKRGREKGKTIKLNGEQQRFLIQNFRAFGAGEINYTQLWEQLHDFESKNKGFDFMAWKKGKIPNLCDRGVVQRFITNYYENRVIEWTLITKGEDFNKSYNQPALGKRASTFKFKNECWEIDSTPADVIIFHEGQQLRPDILAIKDCYSGRCVAHLAVKSNTLAIIRLLWKAIETLGMPKVIKGDNGRDYVSLQFQKLVENLGIRYEKATAYAGDEKGMVERNFRTLQHSYMRCLAGFIGHNVGHRQKIEQQTAKKNRKAKDEFGNIAKTQTASSELLSWDEFDAKLQEAVFLWEIDKKRRKGPSPAELWNECLERVVKIDYENFLVYAGGFTQRTVQKDGINYDGRSYKSSFIHKYRAQKVYVSENIDNMSEVFVFDMKGNLIGVCEDMNISNMQKEDFIKQRKEFVKEVAGIQKEIKNSKLSARSKSNIKDDLRRAKDEHAQTLRPQKTKKIANLDLSKNVENKRRANLLDKATKEVVSESPYADYAVGY